MESPGIVARTVRRSSVESYLRIFPEDEPLYEKAVREGRLNIIDNTRMEAGLCPVPMTQN